MRILGRYLFPLLIAVVGLTLFYFVEAQCSGWTAEYGCPIISENGVVGELPPPTITEFTVSPNPSEGFVTFFVEVNGGGQPYGGEFYEFRYFKHCPSYNPDECDKSSNNYFASLPNYQECGGGTTGCYCGGTGTPQCNKAGHRSESHSFVYDTNGTYVGMVEVVNRGPQEGYGLSTYEAKQVVIEPPADIDVTPDSGPIGPTQVSLGSSATYTATFDWQNAEGAYYYFSVVQGATTYKNSGDQWLGSGSGNVTRSWSFNFDNMAPGTYSVCAWGRTSGYTEGRPVVFNDTGPVGSFLAFLINTARAAIYGNDGACKPVTVGSVQPPQVDLKGNNSDGPLYINSGDSVNLTWTTSGSPTSCTASSNPTGFWSGTKSVTGGSDLRTGITSTRTYTITCSNGSGSDSDSVLVIVSEGPLGDPTCIDNIDNDDDGLTDGADPNCQGAGPTVNLTANPVTVTSGGSTTLQWFTTGNPTNCTASGSWSGSKIPGGGSELRTNITTTQTYVIACSNNFGTAYDSQVVNVQAAVGAAPAVNLTANPTTVDSGGSSTLTWTVTNGATNCAASGGWSGSKNIAGGSEPQSNITSNKQYTLTCSNAYGSGSDSANVSVIAQNRHVDLKINGGDGPVNVPTGQSATLSWTSYDVDECIAMPEHSDWSGTKPDEGSQQTENLTASRTYTIECRDWSWYWGALCTPWADWSDPDCPKPPPDSVTANVLDLPVVDLSANPTSVSNGNTTLLSWTTSNATSCFANGGPWSGTKAVPTGSESSVALSTDTTFTLTCENSVGQNSDAESITIAAAPAGPTNLSLTLDQFFCTNGWNRPRFSWNYPGQQERQVQVDRSSLFTSPIDHNHQSVTGSQNYRLNSQNILLFDTTYYWRVRARDASGVWSEWSNGGSFKTFPYGLVVDLEVEEPNPPVVNQTIFFDNLTTYFGADPTIYTHLWEFNILDPANAPPNSTQRDYDDVTAIYNTGGSKTVRLRLTHPTYPTCEDTLDLNMGAGLDLPIFREIIPK